MTYQICTEHGDEICSGIQDRSTAFRTAKRHATRLGKSVYVYESSDECSDYGEEVRPQ